MKNYLRKIKSTKFNIGIALSGAFSILFFVFLCVISYNIRATSDDLWFYYNVSTKGWLNALLEFEFNVRWFSFSIFNFIAVISKDFKTFNDLLYWYYIATFILLYYSTFRLFNTINKKSSAPILPKTYILILSSVFVAALYFITTNAIEVWFWPIASTIYLYAIIFFMLGSAELLKGRNNISSYIKIVFPFLFLGGTAENFALVAILLFLFYELLYFINYKRLNKKYILAVFATAVFPIVNFFNKGFIKRMSFEVSMLERIPEKSFTDSIILYFNINRIIFFIAILLIVFSLAITLRQKGYKLNNLLLPGRKEIIATILIFIAGTYLPLFFVFGNAGPSRAWIPINFIVCFLLFTTVFMIGNNIKTITIKYFPTLTLSTLSLICIIIFASFFIKQKKITDAYSDAYDKRIEYLQNIQINNIKTDFIVLESLPDSGILSSQELSKRNDIIINLTSRYLGKVVGKNVVVFIKSEENKESLETPY